MAKYDDPRILRAIAHPHRNRILSELYAAGPLRAADIAERADIPANRASFHLRQLAKYGLIVEAPEEARDREEAEVVAGQLRVGAGLAPAGEARDHEARKPAAEVERIEAEAREHAAAEALDEVVRYATRAEASLVAPPPSSL